MPTIETSSDHVREVGLSTPFFSFNYDPNNPRVGDRVMLSPQCPVAEWSELRFGNEYFISSIGDDGSIYLSLPYEDENLRYMLWSPEWLMPAPAIIPSGTRVLFAPLESLDSTYTDPGNVNESMIEMVRNQMNSPLFVNQVSHFESGYYMMRQGLAIVPWRWHRDWMYVTNSPQRVQVNDIDSVPRTGDTIVITEGDRQGLKALVKRVDRTWGGQNTHVVYLEKASRTHYPAACRVSKRNGVTFENQ